VNIALPTAQTDLGFSDSARQWIVTEYALAFGSLLLLGGRIADIFGRKWVFVVGLVGFALASAAGGAAVNVGMLIGARAVQGMFAALLAPAILSLLTTTFTDPAERGKAFGVFGAIAGAGASVGLLLGGFLTEYADWRWTMFVNLIFADAARNRALLVTAAREVFAERGLEASLDDIARHAGLGVGTAYRHFANKYELAEAIFADAVDDIVALAERAAAAHDPWAGIVMFLEGTAEAQTTDRGLREVLMGTHNPERTEQIGDRLSAPLRKLVVRGKRAGVLGQGVESTDLGIVLLMLCTVADVTADSAPDLWRRYLPALLDGLQSDTPLPVSAIDEDDLRTALGAHKQRLARIGQHAPT
jgi:AcrR family transcriptional regulator